jgi:hypothetical protein
MSFFLNSSVNSSIKGRIIYFYFATGRYMYAFVPIGTCYQSEQNAIDDLLYHFFMEENDDQRTGCLQMHEVRKRG